MRPAARRAGAQREADLQLPARLVVPRGRKHRIGSSPSCSEGTAGNALPQHHSVIPATFGSVPHTDEALMNGDARDARGPWRVRSAGRLAGHELHQAVASAGTDRDGTVEAGAAAGMAAAPVAADPDLEPQGVLVAVDAHLDDA